MVLLVRNFKLECVSGGGDDGVCVSWSGLLTKVLGSLGANSENSLEWHVATSA